MERGRLARLLIRLLDIFACLVSTNRLHRVSVSHHMLARDITRFLDTFARLVSIYLLQIDCIVFLFLTMCEFCCCLSKYTRRRLNFSEIQEGLTNDTPYFICTGKRSGDTSAFHNKSLTTFCDSSSVGNETPF